MRARLATYVNNSLMTFEKQTQEINDGNLNIHENDHITNKVVLFSWMNLNVLVQHSTIPYF